MPFQENISSAHIPRPPNAFLCFRSRFIRDQKALAASKGSKSSGMQDISRQAGHIWNDMSDEERSPYVEMANRMKEEHRMAHPDYKFAPTRKSTTRAAPSHSSRAQGPPSRRRPQATGIQRRREPELSPTLDSYNDGSHPIPTLSSPYTSPSSHGMLYMPTDEGNKNFESSYAHSDRPDSWDCYPAQFGTPNASAAFTPSYPMTNSTSPPAMRDVSYHSFEQLGPSFDSEQHPDFGTLCQWDYDFSRSNAASSTNSPYYRPY